MEAEAAARKVAAEAAERERQAIAAMRKAMEFRARPVPREVLCGQPVSMAAAAKRALTVAMSPKFHTTLRSLARRQLKATE